MQVRYKTSGVGEMQGVVMELLDSLTVHDGRESKAIELYHGDLTDLKPEEAVDVLVVSAFPSDYSAVPGTLIGALSDRGVAVWRLAANKAIDLRTTHSCWLSRELEEWSRGPGIQFKRLLCFEPEFRGRAPEVVGDIFRSLVPVLTGKDPIRSVAMPLVACGNQGESVAEILPSLLDAAAHWMSLPDFPLQRLKIVAYEFGRATEAKRLFASLKEKYANRTLLTTPDNRHDIFISYCRQDSDAVRLATAELSKLRPSLKLFQDQMSIQPGAAWQQEIYEAIEHCRVFVPFYSPGYLRSKVCVEEYHLARFCNRESGALALFPIYLFSTDLPAYVRMFNYTDCREGDAEKLRNACARLVAQL
jgi:hypothetical protein